MMKPGAIAILGEALVDVVRDGRGGAYACPGGSGLNTATALARLDAPVAFCGALSGDEDGARLRNHLRDEGVDLAQALITDLPCPQVFATPGVDGSPVYDLRLSPSALEADPGDWRLPSTLTHLHATSFASTTGAQGEAALRALAGTRARASTSFDPNVRRAVLPDLPQARALIAARIAQADIVKISAEDLVELGDADGALLRDWRALGPRLFVVTHGSAGASAFIDGREISVAAPRIVVRDTIGAGDCFMAALLAQMHRDGALGAHRRAFTAEQAAGWLGFAARAAAICCTRAGCDPARRGDLEG